MIKKITFLFVLMFSLTQITNGQTFLSEGFEGAIFPPTGWTVYRGTNGLGTVNDWVQAAAPNTGTYGAANQYENVTGGIAEDWLVTSQIDLTGATGAQLTFYSTQTWGADYGSNYEVKVSTTSQTSHASFTTVASYTEATVGTGYTLQTVNLSAYDGMMIYIAFVHLNDDGDNWIIDDVEVRSPQNNDVKILETSLERYSLVSVDNTLSLNVENRGSQPVTSLEVNWNDGVDHISTINASIAPGATLTVNHPMMVNYSTVEEKDINVTVSLVNGAADQNPTDNSTMAKFNTVSQAGTKAVLIEEATGTWCGWCPRGTVGLDYMTSTYPNSVIGIAVHNSDPMEVAAYDAGINGLTGGGFPNSAVNRVLNGVDPGQSSLQTAYNLLINGVAPVDLSASATMAGSTLTINAGAQFYTKFTNATYRLGVIITEDNVTGTASGYGQVNYYSGGGNGAMGGYENLPSTVPASQMVYNHVGRALLGGFDGQTGSVPTVINNGDTPSETFTYTVPSTSDINEMHVVVVLIDETDGSIVNGKQFTVNETLSTTQIDSNEFTLFPNPVSDSLNVEFISSSEVHEVRVIDMLGRTVYNHSFDTVLGSELLEIPVQNLDRGNYILNISNGNSTYSSKFIKK